MTTPPTGWGPPPAPYAGAPKTDTKAIVALVLAIAAYTPTVPFVGAIAALLVARSARRDIRASGGARTGLGLCTAATVLAWLHLAFLALAAVVVVALLVLGVGFS